MADPINYDEVERIYKEATMSERKDPIVSYEIDDDGVVNYFTKGGAWAGCSDRDTLAAFLGEASLKKGK